MPNLIPNQPDHGGNTEPGLSGSNWALWTNPFAIKGFSSKGLMYQKLYYIKRSPGAGQRIFRFPVHFASPLNTVVLALVLRWDSSAHSVPDHFVVIRSLTADSNSLVDQKRCSVR